MEGWGWRAGVEVEGRRPRCAAGVDGPHQQPAAEAEGRLDAAAGEGPEASVAGEGGGPQAGASREPVLFTAGYQGRTPAGLADELDRRGVRWLVDVRYSPWSRRPEFCGRPLAAALDARGIAYAHFKELGAPPDLRQAFKADGDATRFAGGYRQHLARNGEALQRLQEELAAHGRLCLLCQERDPADCHRLLVAEEMRSRVPGLRVEHIG